MGCNDSQGSFYSLCNQTDADNLSYKPFVNSENRFLLTVDFVLYDQPGCLFQVGGTSTSSSNDNLPSKTQILRKMRKYKMMCDISRVSWHHRSYNNGPDTQV